MRLRALVPILFVLAPLGAGAQVIDVSVDQAVRVTLPQPARDVIVGNPAIVDANVLDATHIVLVGKSSGVTNVMVTDRAGRLMLSRQIVSAPNYGNRVRVYRGPEVSSYACAERCDRSSVSASSSAPAPSPPSQ